MYKHFDNQKKIATPAKKGERVYIEAESPEAMEKHLLKNKMIIVKPNDPQSSQAGDLILEAEIDLDEREQTTPSYK